jgi:hydrogenase maturation protease
MTSDSPCELPTSLVIGYGNTLRGDDGLGPRAAEAVAAWRQPGVRTFAVQQLTPELAETLTGVELVIFIDAFPNTKGKEVKLQRLEPIPPAITLGHASDPHYLLGLARALYGWSPPAWWVLVPGARFELGEGLSSLAARGLQEALQKISILLGRHN